MAQQQVEAANRTTVVKRLVQAAVLTLLLQLIAQLYPSSLRPTTAVQLQETSATFLAWTPLNGK
ncbi:MAG: hypothetical protein WBA10_20950 [Elainellaceae cyanobacterium]